MEQAGREVAGREGGPWLGRRRLGGLEGVRQGGGRVERRAQTGGGRAESRALSGRRLVGEEGLGQGGQRGAGRWPDEEDTAEEEAS
ncbi:hypothetical protein E2562_008761 [Oryza meyeriana var. granulata]|uniref:Uncharacterized protein n=1 Tax=Oryza meyeriana var. granulata TaxID=110450 RepID=A0A6G1CZW7_9ORYZ|nr:hypothetical protein E2562_008761 [Oryza meyeriana var. granulata]